MNRANVIGPPPDLGVDPPDELLLLPDRVEVRRGLAAEAGVTSTTAARSSGPAGARGPRDRRANARPGARGSVRPPPTPSVPEATDRRSGRAATGPRRSDPRPSASGARRRRAGGRAGRECPRCAASPSPASTVPSAPGPSRSRTMPRSEAGGRWSRRRTVASRVLTHGRRRARAETPFLDDRPDPRRDPATEPCQRLDRDAPGQDELGAPVGRDPADGGKPLADRREIAGPVRGRRPAQQRQLERSVDVEREAPPAPKVADRVPGDLGEPSRQRVVAGQVRDVGQRPGTGDRDDIRRVAVVGERGPSVGARRRDEVRVVASRGQRDRAGPQDDEPGRALGTDQLAEACPERCIVGRPADDRDVRRTRPFERELGGARRARLGRPIPSVRSDRRTGPGSGCRIRTVTGRIGIRN